MIAESLGINALDNLIFSEGKVTTSDVILTGVTIIQGMEMLEGGGGGKSSGLREPVAAKTEPVAATSRAARRQAMRDAGIPTSQQPISQSRNSSGREYTYDILEPWGGAPGKKSVQQQTLDSSHPGQAHWEAGKVRIDADGNVKTNSYGRPRLDNQKSKVNY